LGAHSFETEIDPPVVTTPRFRGIAHLVAFVAAAPAGLVLVVHTRAGVAQAGAAVFAVSATMMLGVSTLFHRGNWTPERKRWIGHLDHAMIYVLIAGT
jgi:hemolysin III